MDSVNYIVSAKHYGGSARGYIRKMQQDIHKRGIAVTIRDLDKEPTGTPVTARIWQGQWIADCECNGACFVDPEEPVFFCFTCGNRANGQKPRPVIFPDDWQEIEKLLLERPVNDLAGLTDLERVGMARPVLFVEVEEQLSAVPQGDDISDQPLAIGDQPVRTRILPLTRSWEPGETVEDLRQQQASAIETWKKGPVDKVETAPVEVVDEPVSVVENATEPEPVEGDADVIQ